MANRVNLISAISHIDGAVVIKLPSCFPEYEQGSDLDLLVMDMGQALKGVTEYLRTSFSDNAEIVVESNEHLTHVDLYINGHLDLRFDLISDFSFFRKLTVKESFFRKIFRDMVKKSTDFGDYYVPSLEDDMTIRYFEFIEYFSNAPKKIKHIDYICSIEDEEVQKAFFENTHRYIGFSPQQYSNCDSGIIEYEDMSYRQAFNCIFLCFKRIVKILFNRLNKIIFSSSS